MSGPVRGLLLIAPRADHHVQLLAEQLAHQRWRGSRVVRRVAIDQHIDVGVHIGKTAAHHIALALQRHAPHLRAGRYGDRRGGIAGVVVQHMDGRPRQRHGKITDHCGNGGGLVVAGQQHGDADPGKGVGTIGTHHVGQSPVRGRER